LHFSNKATINKTLQSCLNFRGAPTGNGPANRFREGLIKLTSKLYVMPSQNRNKNLLEKYTFL